MRTGLELIELARVMSDDNHRRTDHRRMASSIDGTPALLTRIRRRFGKRLIAAGNRMVYGRRARTVTPC
ncbi:MAG: hypothetical protein V3V29_03100 [Acidimicrobiia bacterium]